jgi:hypothetical protein
MSDGATVTAKQNRNVDAALVSGQVLIVHGMIPLTILALFYFSFSSSSSAAVESPALAPLTVKLARGPVKDL